MKPGKKSAPKPQPIAKDLPARKNPRGGNLTTAFKFTPVLSSPPNSLQVQNLQYKFNQ
jgi:hypothetical protein